MGIDIHSFQYLLYADEMGVDFERLAVLGRQTRMFDYEQASSLKRERDALGWIDRRKLDSCSYMDPLWELLGSRKIDNFDYSNFEDANVVHDLNKPIDDMYKKKYSLVLDGGTLEHVFNFPVAVKSALEMVAVGGHFISIAPTNNWSDHGFYQFSPEIYLHLLSEKNGFEEPVMLIREDSTFGTKWKRIVIREYVEYPSSITSSNPILLYVCARKISEVDILEQEPSQFIYKAKWDYDGQSKQVDPISGYFLSIGVKLYNYLSKSKKLYVYSLYKKYVKRVIWNKKIFAKHQF